MRDEPSIRAIALFFFFTLLDEVTARQASTAVLSLCEKQAAKQGATITSPIIVYATNRIYKKLKNKNKVHQGSLSYEGGWLLPGGVDLGPWKQFQKESEGDEFLSVVWSKILDITDEQISEGLGVTVGTIRHRVGRGLRRLASLSKASGEMGV